MKTLLMLAAVSEALTGLAVLVFPSIVVRLLFHAEIAGAGVLVGRFAGIALLALAAACWPGGDTRRAFSAMLAYSLLAALYLAYVGMTDRSGILLWPAVAVHVGIAALLVRAWWKPRSAPAGPAS